MRRHRRKQAPYQHEENFLALFELLKMTVYRGGAPDVDFKKLLYAVQHHERQPAKESKPGRRPHFDDAFLFTAAVKMKAILESETGARWRSDQP